MTQGNPSLWANTGATIESVESRVYVFVCHLQAMKNYADFNLLLRELRAVPIMHGVWATQAAPLANELKHRLRRTTGNGDRILVIEVAGEWASRYSEVN